MTPWSKVAVGLMIVAGATALCAGRPDARASAAAAQRDEGASIYRAHCASCHGPTGRGDGAVAPYLRVAPPDLTRIAARNRGVFPADRVRRIIDGRQVLRTHGDSEMPVWGPIFGRSPILPDEGAIDATLGALVDHLESLQDRPAE
jgi:mono/diheme cytochrome c family protein